MMYSIHYVIGLAALQLVDCKQSVLANADLTLNIEPIGVSNRTLIDRLSDILRAGRVRDFLNNTSFRLLHAESGDVSGCQGKASGDSFRAALADYANGRTIFVSGDLWEPESSISAVDTNVQPLPSLEEVAEAARIAGFGDDAVAFATMPPIIENVFPNGTSQRILNIIARERRSAGDFVPVHVNMQNHTASKVAFEQRDPTCDAPSDAAGSVTPRGTPGTARVTISQGGTVLWTLDVVRPSASSGKDGSGVELRYVKYRGRTVLFRAHVPILNVEYKDTTAGCGPTYRDWQNEEYSFTCDGEDVPGLPGFRICKSPSRTIVDAPFKDGGNFNGVSFYVDGAEVVIRSQLRAGWYRYTSEWRLAADGTIRPRFGFGGVLLRYNSCVCVRHHHHAYWRFDFDIETATGNLVREFNDPPLFGASSYHDKAYEIQRPRDSSRKRHWEVSNQQSGRTYGLFPGSSDGNADAYGVGDVWVLKYHADELDDGAVPDTKAHLEKYLTGEALKGRDVVVWYGAHFMHEETHSHNVDGGHIVGPLLKPLKW